VAETLDKLRPDRDLQCYFERPSAIAAFSAVSATGFTISGTWRQQFDWAVVEWNRDNVFEHPLLRNLPDGDLSGLTLTWEETRDNAIPADSDLYPTVDWPYLRVWTRDEGVEDFHQVRLKDHAEPIEGAYLSATAELELQGSPTAGDYVGISFLDEHHTYQLFAIDTLQSAVQAIVDSVNTFSTRLVAQRIGAKVRLTYVGEGQNLSNSTTGANGNRLGVYGFVSGARTEFWTPWSSKFSGGESPTKWRFTLDFSALTAIDSRPVPMHLARKVRWTYAAELQDGAYQRSEFSVVVSNWTVTGANRGYRIAGVGSRRIEDEAGEIQYTGTWTRSKGNFSGGTISHTTEPGATLTCRYVCPQDHELYLGTRLAFNGGAVTYSVDGAPPATESLLIPGEDALARLPLGPMGPGTHTVTVSHAGTAGTYFYFDFLEIAIAATELPSFPADPKVALATDWDTDHSIALAPERTAWLIHKLGFHGRVNHYVGALWFYEMHRPGHVYASATVEFLGTPVFSETTTLRIGRVGEPASSDAVIHHINRVGDTAETIAKAFELELNRGYTAVRATSSGNVLTIHARAMGSDGNLVTVSATPSSGGFQAVASGATLEGGVDGDWRTDIAALPRLNRAVRDWSRSFYEALAGYGLDVVAAFSMELQHGDPSPGEGIAQRYPDGSAVLLNTPALQTNFSPASTVYWRQVHLEMADELAAAGFQPYLQFGEVQWWYFPLAGSGMPFYDDYTTTTFQNTYGRPMQVIPSNFADPAQYPEEVEFLPQLIGTFTTEVMNFVRAAHPNCRFEVLYPTDVNETPLNALINYPDTWTPANLDCMKTESFTYTFSRNLDDCRITILYGETRGFSRGERSFLVGIMDSSMPWMKEVRMAQAENLESIVLFALDQFCLIGYEDPLPIGMRRAVEMG
jgi:hypothetical protein